LFGEWLEVRYRVDERERGHVLHFTGERMTGRILNGGDYETVELRRWRSPEAPQATAPVTPLVPPRPPPAGPPSIACEPNAADRAAITTAKGFLEGGDWEGCLATMVDALSDADGAAGLLMMARCENRGELLLEAQREALGAVELAKKGKCPAVVGEAAALA